MVRLPDDLVEELVLVGAIFAHFKAKYSFRGDVDQLLWAVDTWRTRDGDEKVKQELRLWKQKNSP